MNKPIKLVFKINHYLLRQGRVRAQESGLEPWRDGQGGALCVINRGALKTRASVSRHRGKGRDLDALMGPTTAAGAGFLYVSCMYRKAPATHRHAAPSVSYASSPASSAS